MTNSFKLSPLSGSSCMADCLLLHPYTGRIQRISIRSHRILHHRPIGAQVKPLAVGLHPGTGSHSAAGLEVIPRVVGIMATARSHGPVGIEPVISPVYRHPLIGGAVSVVLYKVPLCPLLLPLCSLGASALQRKTVAEVSVYCVDLLFMITAISRTPSRSAHVTSVLPASEVYPVFPPITPW